MESKKQQARHEMLKKFSKSKGSELHEPTVGENLKAKKLSKVTVVSDSEDGLEKGLTKAQELLKAKLGAKFGLTDEDESEEPSEESEDELEEEEAEEAHDVKACPVKDCELCNEVVAAEKSPSKDEE